jgi:hypothetical protein
MHRLIISDGSREAAQGGGMNVEPCVFVHGFIFGRASRSTPLN